MMTADKWNAPLPCLKDGNSRGEPTDSIQNNKVTIQKLMNASVRSIILSTM